MTDIFTRHPTSLDVVSLYSNIPNEESINAAIELLEEHEESVDMFALSLSDIREMLMFVLESNFFEFDGAIYRQQEGLAMGNHLTPPLAIIFMSKFESRALSEYPLKPLLYRRYIDDCILVWIFGIAAFLAFVDYLNSRHPRIQFTAEYTHTTNSHTIRSYLSSRPIVVYICHICLLCQWKHKSPSPTTRSAGQSTTQQRRQDDDGGLKRSPLSSLRTATHDALYNQPYNTPTPHGQPHASESSPTSRHHTGRRNDSTRTVHALTVDSCDFFSSVVFDSPAGNRPVWK